MKILFISHKWQARTGESASNALAQLGHQVELAWAKIGAVSTSTKLYHWIKRRKYLGPLISLSELHILNDIIIKKTIALQPDLIIVNAGGEVLPSTLEFIKTKTHSKVVCWAGDNPTTYKYSPYYLSGMKYYDHVFLIDPSWYSQSLKDAGVKKYSILPYGVDPSVYKPLKLSNHEMHHYGSDVCHVGSPDQFREQIFSDILDFDLALWGIVMFNHLKFLSNVRDELLPKVRSGVIQANVTNKVYNSAKICLNIQNPQISNMHSNKSFEITASGALLFTSYYDKSYKYFDNNEIISFKDSNDLRKLLVYYLNNESERIEIAANGYKRTISNHLYKHRMLELLEEITM